VPELFHNKLLIVLRAQAATIQRISKEYSKPEVVDQRAWQYVKFVHDWHSAHGGDKAAAALLEGISSEQFRHYRVNELQARRGKKKISKPFTARQANDFETRLAPVVDDLPGIEHFFLNTESIPLPSISVSSLSLSLSLCLLSIPVSVSHTALSHCSLTLLSLTALSHCPLSLPSLTALSHCPLSLPSRSLTALSQPVIFKLPSHTALCHCPLTLISLTALSHCSLSLPSHTALFHCPLSLPSHNP
jgi:hypothetical protein